MNGLISVYPNICQGCGACVRVCPSPEANYFKIEDGKRITAINDDKCIACGKCISACPHDARDFEDDSEKFFKAVNEKRIILIVSPAIKAAFPDTWQGVLKWLRQEGVYALYDMSLGGDICTWANLRLFEQEKISHAVSSHCPAMVNYVNVRYPDKAEELLSPVYSPAACMAVYIKTYLKSNYSMAVLSPCTAVRTDPSECNLIDYSVTFKRLEERLTRKRVKLPKNSDAPGTSYFEDEQGMLGSAVFRKGGLQEGIWARNADINVFASDSRNAFSSTDNFVGSAASARPAFADVISCSHGCVYGHAADWDISEFERENMMHLNEVEGRSRRKTGIAGIVGNTDKQFKHFDDIFNVKSFMRTYKPEGEPPKEVSVTEINHVFADMGKETDAQKNLNCGCCGYSSCSEMAEAICRGLNIPENCIAYAQSAITGNHREHDMTIDEASGIADEISDIADSITKDLNKIYENLSGMAEANKQTSQKSDLVSNVLSKIIGFCDGNETIDENELPVLVSTLEKLQATLDNMNHNVKTVTSDSAALDENVRAAAENAEKLNEAIERMKESFNSKY